MRIEEKLIEFRKRYGYLQEDVAGKLEVSRQTYMKMESGEKSVSIAQLEILANLYGIPVEEFMYDVQNTDKFKQMYVYFLSKFGKAGVPKTKLAKLLYLADFRHFYDTLEPMSGVLYRCKTYGPLADSFLEITDEMYETGAINIECLSMGAQMIALTSKPKSDAFSLLSEGERRELDEIFELWKDANTQVIVNYTHNQKPWMECRENEIIPYVLILQEEPDNVYTPTI